MTQFNSGMQAIQEAIEKGKKRTEAARTASSGSSLNYFNWKPGDRKILRFLADDAIPAEFYDFIVDRTGQTKNFMVDPAEPDRLFRYMSPTPGIGWRRDFKTGALEEPKKREMTVGVAVLRIEVPHDGKMVIEDYIYEKDVAEATFPARFFGIVQQSTNNFWHTLAVSVFNRYGTICDRDYEITRSGTGFDTKYDIIPLDPVPELTDIEMVKKFYGYGEPWNPDDPQRYLKCPMTTVEWATYFCGEERYQFWLTPEGAAATAATPSGLSGGYSNTGLNEFHPATTSNDEAQALAPPAPTGRTTFSSLTDELINAAKNKK